MRLKKLFAAAIAAGIVLSQAAGIGPASAGTFDMACNYERPVFNACLSFHPVPNDYDTLHAVAGLDAHMPQSYAQDIVNGGGFAAYIYAANNGNPRYLADLHVSAGWPGAGTDGLGIELDADISRYVLDENRSGDDRLFAVVWYFDNHGGIGWVGHRTGTVQGDFGPYVDPGPSCLILC